ncbi:MAG: hypothetical protein O6846_01890 [Thaumarchaeota archaeon]|nr:hypothetical protein [Nitrososphaerota archaeon]
MGRTIPAFRIALEEEISTWKDYKRVLSGRSRKSLEDLFNAARKYCSASSHAVRPVRFQGMFMAIVLDHEVKLEYITREIEKMRLKISVRV